MIGGRVLDASAIVKLVQQAKKLKGKWSDKKREASRASRNRVRTFAR